LLDDWYGRAGSVNAMRELVRPFLTGPVDEAAFHRFCGDAARVPRPALEGTMRGRPRRPLGEHSTIPVLEQ